MTDPNHVTSLADFQQNALDHIAELKRTGKPEVLTIEGRAEVVVQDVSSYQALLDELDRAQSVAGIRRGLEQANRGEGRPMREVLAELIRSANDQPQPG